MWTSWSWPLSIRFRDNFQFCWSCGSHTMSSFEISQKDSFFLISWCNITRSPTTNERLIFPSSDRYLFSKKIVLSARTFLVALPHPTSKQVLWELLTGEWNVGVEGSEASNVNYASRVRARGSLWTFHISATCPMGTSRNDPCSSEVDTKFVDLLCQKRPPSDHDTPVNHRFVLNKL